MKLLIVLITSVVIIHANEQLYKDKKRITEECYKQNGWSREQDEKINMDAKIEELPKEVFCSAKCLDEKLGIIKDGRISIEIFQNTQTPLMKQTGNHEEFLKCLGKIDASKPCENYTEVLQCRRIHKDQHRILKECYRENNWTIEKSMKVNMNANLEKIPKEVFCSAKCLDDKVGMIKDGKIVIEKLRKNKALLADMTDTREFMKCVQKIDIPKNCEDYTNILQCSRKFDGYFLETCLEEKNMKMKEFNKIRFKYMKRNINEKELLQYACMNTCLFEKRGILNEDRTLNMKKLNEKSIILDSVLDQKNLSKCLEGLRITKCGDFREIWGCQINNI